MSQDAPVSNKLVLSWEDLHLDMRLLSSKLHNITNWQSMVCVTRGGLVPASIIAWELNIRHIDTLCVASYKDTSNHKDQPIQDNLQTFKSIQNVQSENILVIDDLVDTGNTAQLIRKLLPHAHIATPYAKPLGIPFVDTYLKKIEQETWIVFPWETNNPIITGEDS